MFIIALNNLMEILPATKKKWEIIMNKVVNNCKKYLWDTKAQKIIPHIYLDKGSPFPIDFNENEIYYFGGTAIAIEAGLLNKQEVKTLLDEMEKKSETSRRRLYWLNTLSTLPGWIFCQ